MTKWEKKWIKKNKEVIMGGWQEGGKAGIRGVRRKERRRKRIGEK